MTVWSQATVQPPFCRHLAVLTVSSLLLLPAYVDGWGANDPDPGVADIRVQFLAAVNQARSVHRICGNTRYSPATPVSWSGNLAMASQPSFQRHGTD
jgi:hypothetical protein